MQEGLRPAGRDGQAAHLTPVPQQTPALARGHSGLVSFVLGFFGQLCMPLKLTHGCCKSQVLQLSSTADFRYCKFLLLQISGTASFRTDVGYCKFHDYKFRLCKMKICCAVTCRHWCLVAMACHQQLTMSSYNGVTFAQARLAEPEAG